MHAVIHQALGQAVKQELAVRNVSDAVALSRYQPKEERPLSRVEQGKLLAVLDVDPLGAAFPMLLVTGLRKGELLDLRWEDIDLGSKEVHVRRGLVATRQGLIFHEPKSATSLRAVPLLPRVVKALRVHRVKQNAVKLRQGEAYHDQDLVFCKDTGDRPNSLARRCCVSRER